MALENVQIRVGIIDVDSVEEFFWDDEKGERVRTGRLLQLKKPLIINVIDLPSGDQKITVRDNV